VAVEGEAGRDEPPGARASAPPRPPRRRLDELRARLTEHRAAAECVNPRFAAFRDERCVGERDPITLEELEGDDACRVGADPRRPQCYGARSLEAWMRSSLGRGRLPLTNDRVDMSAADVRSCCARPRVEGDPRELQERIQAAENELNEAFLRHEGLRRVELPSGTEVFYDGASGALRRKAWLNGTTFHLRRRRGGRGTAPHRVSQRRKEVLRGRQGRRGASPPGVAQRHHSHLRRRRGGRGIAPRRVSQRPEEVLRRRQGGRGAAQREIARRPGGILRGTPWARGGARGGPRG
jgi:hypothetical protein